MSSGYKFSRRIGRGGMAEVYLAMREGVGGFEKLVVVKRIFSHFCEDQRFITMFLDEARLAASISHPNVVEIFDIGEDEDGYFMAMEYLSGETLALIFETLRAKQTTIPAPIIARIGANVAAGLHYAHTATDGSGTPLDIVHRDVTPSNIIVGFSGTTKIVDFGIAKAQLRDSQTRSGALKGKMAYLSPEQIEDLPVDHRTDVFQLGIVLHELLTGLRLFDADGDHQKMMAVMERPILPPSEVNPYVPKVFDDVVLRALQRDVDKRTQSADQLRRELEYALKQLGSTVSDHDVSDWMQSTFADRYHERIAMERESVSQMRSGVRQKPAASSKPSSTTNSGGKTPTLATVVGRPQSRQTEHPKKGPPLLLIGGAAIGVAIGGILFWRGGGGSEPEPSQSAAAITGAADASTASAEANPAPTPTKFKIKIQVEPAHAAISIDNKRRAEGFYEGEFPADGRDHLLEVTADGYKSWRRPFKNSLPELQVVLSKDQAAVVATQQTVTERKSAPRASPEPPTRAKRDKSTVKPGPANVADTTPKPTSGAEDSKSPAETVKSPKEEGASASSGESGKQGDKWRKSSGSDNIDPWEKK